ncbi:glycosyltransferase [Roseomonas sp. CCTCC AB2023176]|uniref:glycosyltransferase n=1 Tax=Roseomonas sp. CCTCC AB2023176 TaxID=3342640 RepID=UPI0035E02071
MRILLWYWGRRGGGASFALHLARGLAARGDVALGLSLAERNELLDAFRALPAPLDAVPTFAGAADLLPATLRVPLLRRRLVAQARAMGADAVVSAMNHVWTPLVAPALPRAGLRYVAAIHDATPHPGDPAFAWDWRLRRELGSASGAIAFSEAVSAAVAARRPGLPVLRLPLPGLAPPAAAGMPTTDVLFFGRLRAYKGLDLLRDAWPRLRARHPHATLRVVGEGDPEACAPGLAALPGVTVEARWVAEDAIAALLATARVLVLPYREASQSGVVPIALALGVPPVVTPVGGLAEQVRDGETGIVAAAPTAEALAAAMAKALDPARHSALTARAREAGRPLADPAGAADALVAWLRTLPPAAT